MNIEIPEFSIENSEILDTVESLDISEDKLTDPDILKRLTAAWEFYHSQGELIGFPNFIRKIISKVGHQPGVHPLDTVYSFILSDGLKEEVVEADGDLRLDKLRLIEKLIDKL